MSMRKSLVLPDDVVEAVENVKGLAKWNTYLVHLIRLGLQKHAELEKEKGSRQ